EHHLSRGGAPDRREAENPDAEDELLLARGGARRQAARRADGYPRAGLYFLPGTTAQAGSGACTRISRLTRNHAGDHRRVSHGLRARLWLPSARCAARAVGRRTVARVGPVLVERQKSVASCQWSVVRKG